MDTLIRVLGWLAVATIVSMGVLFLLLAWFWRRVKAAAAAAGDGKFPVPAQITLREDTDPRWAEKAEPKAALAALATAGFQRAGAFNIEEMPGLRLIGLVHPATGVMAVCYEHPQAGHWVDLCAYFEEGLELTLSNAPQGETADTRPGTEKIFIKGTTAELLARLSERIEGRALRRIEVAQFAADVQAAYGRDVTWRNARLGVSREEFVRQAAKHPAKLTEEQIEQGFTETKLQEMRRWVDEALEAFAKTTTLSVAEWKKHEGRMVIFNENFNVGAYLDYLHEGGHVPEAKLEGFREKTKTGWSAREMLDEIGQETATVVERLGAVEHPLRLEIYSIRKRD